MYIYLPLAADRLLESGKESFWDVARKTLSRFRVERFLSCREVVIVNKEGIVIEVVKPTGVTIDNGRLLMEGAELQSPKIGNPSPRLRRSMNSVAFEVETQK